MYLKKMYYALNDRFVQKSIHDYEYYKLEEYF